MRTLTIPILDHNNGVTCTQKYIVQKKATGEPGFTLVGEYFGSPIVITGIADSTEYEISIQRECCGGTFSEEVIIPINTLPLTDEIEGLALTPASETIAINWDDFTDADGYVVYQNTVNDINTATLIYDNTTSATTAVDLDPSTTYYFWVAAYIGDRFSAFEAASATTTA